MSRVHRTCELQARPKHDKHYGHVYGEALNGASRLSSLLLLLQLPALVVSTWLHCAQGKYTIGNATRAKWTHRSHCIVFIDG